MDSKLAAKKSKTLLEYRTYSGVLDDVLPRYSEVYEGTDLFNKMIVKNLLFGGSIYLNDGYLVNNSESRAQLFQERSLLRTMIRTGFIHIYTRAADADKLLQVPETMKKQGNISFGRLVNSSSWPEFKRQWERVTKAAYLMGHTKRWPNRDTSIGYVKLYKDYVALDKTEPHKLGLDGIPKDILNNIHTGFLAREPELSGPRDKFERAALTAFGFSETEIPANLPKHIRAAMHKLMEPANQIYHYNHGLALCADNENDIDNKSISVDTSIGPVFTPMLETTPINLEQLEDLPIFNISTNLLLRDGMLLWELCAPDTALFEAKTNYLTCMEEIIQGHGQLPTLKQQLTEASTDYSSLIQEHLSSRFGKSATEDDTNRSFLLELEQSEFQTEDTQLDNTVSLNLHAATDDRSEATNLAFMLENFVLPHDQELKSIKPMKQEESSMRIKIKDLTPHIACLT